MGGRKRLTRVALIYLAFSSLLVGPWAQFAPGSFWDGFPAFDRGWVSTDGAYNEHLIRDVGGLQLAMAVVLIAAALRPTVALVRTAALASVVWQAPHVVYHLIHAGDLPTLADRIAQSAALVLTLTVVAFLLVFAPRDPDPSAGPSE